MQAIGKNSGIAIDRDVVSECDGVDRASSITIDGKRQRPAVKGNGIDTATRCGPQRATASNHVTTRNTAAISLEHASIDKNATAYGVDDAPGRNGACSGTRRATKDRGTRGGAGLRQAVATCDHRIDDKGGSGIILIDDQVIATASLESATGDGADVSCDCGSDKNTT